MQEVLQSKKSEVTTLEAKQAEFKESVKNLQENYDDEILGQLMHTPGTFFQFSAFLIFKFFIKSRIENQKTIFTSSPAKKYLGTFFTVFFYILLYRQKSNTVSGEFLGRLVLGLEGDMVKVFGATIY